MSRPTWHPDPQERARRLVAAEVAVRALGETANALTRRMSRWSSYWPRGHNSLRGWGGTWPGFQRLVDTALDGMDDHGRAFARYNRLLELHYDAEEAAS